MEQSLEDARFIIDIGLATGIVVQFKGPGDRCWYNRSRSNLGKPPWPNTLYRFKPPETPPHGG
jgi:hypothetical protein